MQERDAFYGYFQAQPGVSNEGINIKISHTVYCGGECTVDFYRLDKAEYLGRPYYDHDLLFFRIKDNAVYLKAGSAEITARVNPRIYVLFFSFPAGAANFFNCSVNRSKTCLDNFACLFMINRKSVRARRKAPLRMPMGQRIANNTE
jgi:hypothetical protein